MRTLSRALALLVLPLLFTACDTATYDNGKVYSAEVEFRVRNATLNGSVLSQQYNVPRLTRTVAQGGIVLAFYREQNTWTAMPYTYGVESPDIPAVDYVITLGYAYEEGFVEVFYESSVADQNLLRGLPDRRIKLVLLDTDVLASNKQGIDLRNWEQVKAAFGLED